MNRRLTTLLFATLGAHGALAQTSFDNATIQALLVEVRHLRLALERSAVVGPKIQLALQRLELQQVLVSRLSQQLEDLRDQTARSVSEDARTMAHLKSAETRLAQEQDALRRKALEEEITVLKASGRLQTEQAKLNQTNDRLNDLENLLDTPPKLP